MVKTIKNYKRKIIQLAVAILYNCNFLGFKNANIYQGPLKNFCTPGLNCYSCPGAILSCPLGSFQSFIAKRTAHNFIERIPIYVLGFLILCGIILGRIICGFLCPFGLIQEVIYKIKTPKVKKSKITHKLTYIRYFILLIFVILIPIFYFAPGFCKFICPAGTLEAGIPLVSKVKSLQDAIGFIFFQKMSILILLLILSIFGITVDKNKCTNCDKCEKYCLMDIKSPGDSNCIDCGKCISICPHNAIAWKNFKS